MKNERRLLHEEIVCELGELNKLELGSEQHKSTIDGVGKLLDRAIEMDRLEAENRERMNSRNAELELKERQMNEDKKDRIVKNIIAVSGIVLPICVTVWGTFKTIEFEKEGIITTTIGRGFFNKLLPKK